MKNKLFTVKFKLKNGKEKERTFYHDGYGRKDPMKNWNIDQYPNLMIYACRTSLADRLKAGKCELCGKEGTIQMHHVHKLGDLSGKANWEKFMIARRRKTLALCESCHKKIHYGTN